MYKTIIKPLDMIKNNKDRDKIIPRSRSHSETCYFMLYFKTL